MSVCIFQECRRETGKTHAGPSWSRARNSLHTAWERQNKSQYGILNLDHPSLRHLLFCVRKMNSPCLALCCKATHRKGAVLARLAVHKHSWAPLLRARKEKDAPLYKFEPGWCTLPTPLIPRLFLCRRLKFATVQLLMEVLEIRHWHFSTYFVSLKIKLPIITPWTRARLNAALALCTTMRAHAHVMLINYSSWLYYSCWVAPWGWGWVVVVVDVKAEFDSHKGPWKLVTGAGEGGEQPPPPSVVFYLHTTQLHQFRFVTYPKV